MCPAAPAPQDCWALQKFLTWTGGTRRRTSLDLLLRPICRRAVLLPHTHVWRASAMWNILLHSSCILHLNRPTGAVLPLRPQLAPPSGHFTYTSTFLLKALAGADSLADSLPSPGGYSAGTSPQSPASVLWLSPCRPQSSQRHQRTSAGEKIRVLEVKSKSWRVQEES